MAEITSHPPGAFCWIELGTSSQEAAKDFYGKLFGWSFLDNEMGPRMTYTEWILGDAPIGGMMAMPSGAQTPPHWLPYFAVADCDAAASKAAALGAKTYVPPTDIPGTGRFAVLADPQGATFAIYRQ